MRSTIVLAVAAIALSVIPGASARSFYVATNGNHTTAEAWSSAYTNLQQAVDEAVDGDVIHLAGQVFTLRAPVLWAQKGIAIQGGYAAADDLDLPGTRDASLYPTVLERPASSTNRIMQATGVTNGTLSGVTLRNGLTSEVAGGAGLLARLCDNLTVENCTIANNTTINGTLNLGNLFGGGMSSMTNTALLVTNCVFTGNRAQTSYSSTIAHANGAGLALLGGSATVVDSLFDQNSLVAARNSYGGGIYAYGGAHRIENTVVTRNWSYQSNGGISYNRGDGIHVGLGTTDVVNAFIIGNNRDGVYVDNGLLRLQNSTVTLNGQNGIRRMAGILAVTNSIVWRNINDVSGTVQMGYSLVGNPAIAGTNGIVEADPLFERGLYLATNSPAVDAGTNTAAFWSLDGLGTAADGTADAGTADMGAHFRPAPAVSVAENAVMFDPNLADLYVDAEGSDLNDGLTAGNPFQTITRALAVASAGSVIHVAAGTYTNAPEVYPLVIRRPGIQILGAGEDQTIIRVIGSVGRVFDVWGVSGFRLEDLTLTGGAGNVAAYYAPLQVWDFMGRRGGGGVHAVCSSMDLADVVISNNTVTGRGNEHPSGGGMQAMYSFGSMERVRVESNRLVYVNFSNTGDGLGGGLYLYDGSWTLEDCVIASNSAIFGANGGNYGGGLYLSGAHTIRNSRITANTAGGRGNTLQRGSGVYMLNGTLDGCVIDNNSMPFTTSLDAFGGGVYQLGGLIRNCLLAGNTAVRGAGGLYATAGQSENVTIGGNRSTEPSTIAGAVLSGTAAMTNAIVSGNTCTFSGDEANMSASGGSVGYTITSPARAGTENVDAEPGFEDPVAGNYRLRAGSPAIDTGFTLPWMATGADLDGGVRIRGGTSDRGAYEAMAANEGPLRVNFTADVRTGQDSLAVTFSTSIAGSNTTGVVYSWDYDNDSVADEVGADKQTVTHTFPIGFHSVRLAVANGIGEASEFTQPLYIKVFPSAVYIRTGGDNQLGLSWAHAFTNFEAAAPYISDNSTVYLAGETFAVTQPVILASFSGVTVLGGYEAAPATEGPGPFDPEQWPTVIKRASGSIRVLDVSNVSSVRVARVTLTGGSIPADVTKGVGGGIRVNASSITFEDCVISNNQANAQNNGYAWGGGVYAAGSDLTFRRTLFDHNRVRSTPSTSNNRTHGGAIASENCLVTVEACRFIGNDSYAQGYHQSYGGALYLSGGTNTVRSSLFYGNVVGNPAKLTGWGGAVYLLGSTVLENCTIASNHAWNANLAAGGGVFQSAGALTNCVVWHNAVSNSPSDLAIASAANIGYSCSPDLTDGENGNITADPLLVNLAEGLLAGGSPCRNAGLYAEWMTGAYDLAGRARILGGRVDMGALEILPPAGTLIFLK